MRKVSYPSTHRPVLGIEEQYDVLSPVIRERHLLDLTVDNCYMMMEKGLISKMRVSAIMPYICNESRSRIHVNMMHMMLIDIMKAWM